MPLITTRRPARAALLALVATVSAAGLAAPASAAGSRYLALGDSVTFGYQEAQVVPAPDYALASSFVNYPQQLGAVVGLRVTNPACPGETSASLIDASAQSNGCENSLGPGGKRLPVGYRTRYPLHVRYTGSQLAYAVRFLRAHRGVRLVSLMIGANDVFLCQKTTSDGCLSQAEQQALFAKIAANVRRILSAIRTRAGYHGQLAIVRYYSLDYASPLVNGVIKGLNRAVVTAARPFHIVVADGYATFGAAAAHSANSTCDAALLTQLGRPGTCGVHPSYAGQALLAQAVGEATGPWSPQSSAGRVPALAG